MKAMNYWEITVSKDHVPDINDNRIKKDCIKLRFQDGTAGYSAFLTPETARQFVAEIEKHLA